jgi:hypothetical protein
MSCKFYTVDRIEEDIAVLYERGGEESKTDIPAAELPEYIKEGDILQFDEESKTYTVDCESTARVKADIEERFRKLFRK